MSEGSAAARGVRGGDLGRRSGLVLEVRPGDGQVQVNVLPRPGALRAVRGAAEEMRDLPADGQAPGRCVLAAGRAVRLLDAPKIVSSCCSAIPIPVPFTRKATTPPPRCTESGSSCSAAGSMRSSTLPRSVNLTALEIRFRRTWRSRESSVSRLDRTPGAVLMVKVRLFCVVIGRNVAST
ncbi:hypothetical protein GCM10020227_52790 [Streptomyces flavovirens]